ncbi:MAG: DUF5655 domain-containing protein [Acidobacteria bacterium]|nr:DUF5655 domain-containing protein [Acidobacteriota bacterium]MCA1610535.1 DUF5655 domain-containing protein [Acidobacteriota bacterium]
MSPPAVPLRAKPLWRCPRCARLFANRNQTHACGRHELLALFAGRDPAIFELFQSLEKLVRRCGPVTVLPEKTRIAFQARVSFLAVSPRQMHLIGHFVFARRVPNPRFQKIDTISPRNVVHHFCLERPDELDEEFQGWIREAYAVGRQEPGS